MHTQSEREKERDRDTLVRYGKKSFLKTNHMTQREREEGSSSTSSTAAVSLLPQHIHPCMYTTQVHTVFTSLPSSVYTYITSIQVNTNRERREKDTEEEEVLMEVAQERVTGAVSV